MEIPQDIIHFAKRYAQYGSMFGLEYDEDFLKERRDAAIEAIGRYRDVKKALAEAEKRKQTMKDWLISINEPLNP